MEASEEETSLQSRISARETGEVEPELPSSSQFYYFFNPIVDSGMSLSDLSMQFEINALPSSSIHHQSNVRHTLTLQNVNSVSGLYSYGSSKGDLDVRLLAEEYEQLLGITAENEKLIKEKEIILDMQDKELEAVIADIAQLCDLNVTLTRNIREARERRNCLKERARKCRIEHLSYETGAIMLASENRELSAEIEKLQHEIEEANKAKNNLEVYKDETLSDKADSETHIQLERHGIIGKSDKEKPSKYEYENLHIPRFFYDGEPCFEHLNKTCELQKGDMNLLQRKPANDMFTCDTITVISPNFNAEDCNVKKHLHIEKSTTLRPENAVEHFHVFGSRLYSSDCTLSTESMEISDTYQEDYSCEKNSSLMDTKKNSFK